MLVHAYPRGRRKHARDCAAVLDLPRREGRLAPSTSPSTALHPRAGYPLFGEVLPQRSRRRQGLYSVERQEKQQGTAALQVQSITSDSSGSDANPPLQTATNSESPRGESHDRFTSQPSSISHQPIDVVPPQQTRNIAPDVSLGYTATSGQSEAAHAIDTPAASVSESHIGPEQPLAHNVGLLSLGNASSDPKYLGPSSGVSFARLIYAAAPQTQGLPASISPVSAQGLDSSNEPVVCVPLPRIAQMHRFVDSYLEAFNHLYPFLKREYIHDLIERTC